VHCNATYSVIKISSEAEKLLQSDHQSQLPQFLLWASIMNFFFDGTRYFWLQCDYFVPPFRHSTNHCELLKNASPCIKIYHVRQKFKTFPERGTGPSQTITYVAMGSLLPISHSSVLTAPRSSRLPCSGHPSFKLVPIPCDTGISEQKVQISNGDITFAASRRNIIVAIIDVRPMSYLHTRNVRIS